MRKYMVFRSLIIAMVFIIAMLLLSAFTTVQPAGASHFGKSITQSNDSARVSAPLKTANVQKRDAPQPTKERQCFVNEIIQKLGKDGQACSERNGRTYCISADLQSPKPIAVGDMLKPGQELWICLQSNGLLTDCKPSTSFDVHCAGDPGAGGGCRCRGIDSCLKMAEREDCVNGSCGDCTGADCCCEF